MHRKDGGKKMNGREVNAGIANGMEMNQKFCQCCGMPMGNTDEQYGTNADGSKNEDYCKYCFENGGFTFQGSMEEMIEICVPPMTAAHPEMTEEEAKNRMREWFPTLKRWKK
jgi:hypothetical protein